MGRQLLTEEILANVETMTRERTGLVTDGASPGIARAFWTKGPNTSTTMPPARWDIPTGLSNLDYHGRQKNS